MNRVLSACSSFLTAVAILLIVTGFLALGPVAMADAGPNPGPDGNICPDCQYSSCGPNNLAAGCGKNSYCLANATDECFCSCQQDEDFFGEPYCACLK